MKTTALFLLTVAMAFGPLKTTSFSFSQQSNPLTADEIIDTEIHDRNVNIKAFPNPVDAGSWIIVQTIDQNNVVNCDLLSHVKELSVYNIAGKKVTSVTPKPGSCNIRIDTQDMETGLYVIYGKTKYGQDISPIKVQVR
jgi:hypothetical protein